MKRALMPVAVAFAVSGCCAVTCNTRPPNSHVKVSSDIVTECTFEDKAGIRQFYAPGEVLGMPKNAPGILTCNAKGYKTFSKTINAQDWSLLTAPSDDPDALRYFSAVSVTMEALKK